MWRKEFNLYQENKIYNINDIVVDTNHNTYIALQSSQGKYPPFYSEYWHKIINAPKFYEIAIPLGKVVPTYKGNYEDGTIYKKYDIVTKDNNNYLCTVETASSSQEFNTVLASTEWQQLTLNSSTFVNVENNIMYLS